jgi:hypothetical protein
VVRAEESRRTRGGDATSDATKNSGMPGARNVADIRIQQFCKNVYGKPRAYILGKPL